MGEHSAIEWTEATFNTHWGCTRVSDECTHCYAETLAKRFNVKWGKNADRRFFGDKHWNEPLAWNRKAAKRGVPMTVFCSSMADVFEDRRDLDGVRDRLWELIGATPWLVWQLLTKRPECVVGMVPKDWLGNSMCDECTGTGHLGPDSSAPQRLYGATCPSCDGSGAITGAGWPMNVRIGTTAGHQKSADERLPHLVRIPAPVRFVSVEPMLGPVDLSQWLADPDPEHEGWAYVCQQHGVTECRQSVECSGVQWVICGGESGSGARPMDPQWTRSLRDQVTAAGVPFMFKQWGQHAPVVVEEDPSFSGGKAFDHPEGGRLALRIRERSVEAFKPNRPRDMEPGDETRGGVQMLGSGEVIVHLRSKHTAGRMLDGRTWDGMPPLVSPFHLAQ